MDKVGFGKDEDDTLASLDDGAGEGLIQFAVRLGGVDKESTDISLFDGGEATQGGELFNADFALSLLAKTSSI